MRALLGAGRDVRVLVRNAGRFTHPQGVEVVEGDLTNADDVRRALRSVDRAFLNMADDNGAVFARVAGELRLDHVVLAVLAASASNRRQRNTCRTTLDRS